MKKRLALLGFGKVGQTIFSKVENDPVFGERFEIAGIWNRSKEVFNRISIPDRITIYEDVADLMTDLNQIDLVVEVSHPSVLLSHAKEILKLTDLFVASPTVFANENFRKDLGESAHDSAYHCYIPLGASVGLWDIIRLDQLGLIKNLTVSMSKEPASFKIQNKETLAKIKVAIASNCAVEIATGSVGKINAIAPQNTNTMSVYALAAQSLGFDQCQGRIIADPALTSHIVACEVETHKGLSYSFVRDNPAETGAVTGSATFGSFLHSLLNYDQGLKHGRFTFC